MTNDVRFDILDSIGFWQRTALLTLCGLTCCWGFTNNMILLVFGSKIGFPLAVTACATQSNRQQVTNMLYYTLLLITIGTLYFTVSSVQIDYSMAKNYTPDVMDFVLAVGLGSALSVFWHHALRINLIILGAALASLLPACIMAGYGIANNLYYETYDSLALYLEYVVGMAIGATITRKVSI